jgi:CubicO group peptidase (beta-lactamase class C family)
VPAGDFSAADQVLEAAIGARAFPGAVLAAGRDRAVDHLKAFGRLSYDPGDPPADPHTIYDLASLTKVIVTTTMAMLLVDEGRLDVSWPLARLVPEFRGEPAKQRVTLAHLLSHASGLPAWAPLYEGTSGKDAFVARIASMDLMGEPGTRSVYSDLGFILLGAALERAAGATLETFASERILGPLGMSETRYLPPPAWRRQIAPTEDDPWRGRVLRGEVHDENAHAMGGVAPHSGLFGTAPDLARFAMAILAGGIADGRRFIREDTRRLFFTPCGIPGSSYALGWDMPSGESSTAGRLMSRRSIGHLGFTGTSVWIDPDRRLFVILLSNRVHPTRANDPMRAVRAAVADAVVTAFEG